MVVDQRTGQAVPVTSNGQPLGAKLKDIPVSVNSAFIQNQKSATQIDNALKLLSGQDIGDTAEGGMAGDKSATGWKGYLPNGLLNRVDPKGVDTRAVVSDIGSLTPARPIGRSGDRKRIATPHAVHSSSDG